MVLDSSEKSCWTYWVSSNTREKWLYYLNLCDVNNAQFSFCDSSIITNVRIKEYPSNKNTHIDNCGNAEKYLYLETYSSMPRFGSGKTATSVYYDRSWEGGSFVCSQKYVGHYKWYYVAQRQSCN